MTEYEVGQEVRRFETYARVRDTEGTPGKVVKVGRSLVHVEFSGWHVEAYRIDTGVINDSYGHTHILTLPELADWNRRAAALAVLDRGGLRFKSSSTNGNYTTDQLEILAQAINQMGMG